MSDPTIYTVGWICAIKAELIAATTFLDEEHEDPEHLPVNDNNAYILGRVGKHNVIIASLPHGEYGLTSAATIARDMVRSFPNVRIGLMVGIGGGAPSSKHDIRLGDIVVSSPGSGNGGVFQYDYGKTIQDKAFTVTRHLDQPPQCLLTAISVLEAQYERDGHDIQAAIDHALEKKPRLRAKYKKPDYSTDRLYSSAYKHAGTKEQECLAICVDASQLVARTARSEEDIPMIHFGLIASANQLIKDANIRDRLSAEEDVLCFEMEAAGLMNHFPCLIIRGICDYSDTHKNKVWQGYAAMAAAAFAKDLLYKVAPNKIEAERKLIDVLDNGV
jgi:nucleoside phosphorylase